jgi:hypothetical protein
LLRPADHQPGSGRCCLLRPGHPLERADGAVRSRANGGGPLAGGLAAGGSRGGGGLVGGSALLGAGQAPAARPRLHAAVLLGQVHRGRVLQADDLVQQDVAVDASFVVDRPALAIVGAGLAVATPVRMVTNDRATSASRCRILPHGATRPSRRTRGDPPSPGGIGAQAAAPPGASWRAMNARISACARSVSGPAWRVNRCGWSGNSATSTWPPAAR